MESKKYSVKKMLCIVLILGMLTFVFSSSVFAQAEYKWRFGLPWSREIQTNSMQLFCDLAELYSGGKIKITLYPDGALGPHDELFRAIQGGSVEMGIFAPYTHLVPGGMLNWMPWSIDSYDQLAVAFSWPNGISYKLMSKAYEEVGFHLLFNGIEGPYGIANNVRPIKTPDDFKNLKMRVAPAIVNLKNLEHMGEGTGMTLATIPWADLYNALERGVVDGCWSMWSSMVEERHYEVLKYYTVLDWIWGVNNIVVNKEKWEELPQEIKDALVKAGKYAELVEFEAHRRADHDFIKIIEDGGVEIYYPTQEERALFREKAKVPVLWEDYAKPWIEENYPGQNMTQKALDELKLIRENY